ncbi:tyrosine-type recombinase/integrase [Methylorubrum sp. POS3]|uniref:tyrosine-type recombinase/integrase n=1 Tax=Methylorubrum sp. POS3 TaxID=2998492 RepID=UPI00372658C0
MSVYKRPDSSFYWCEFTIEGDRFRLSTGQTERRAAQLAEKQLKAEAKADRAAEKAQRKTWGGKPAPTMGYLVELYWEEVGKHHAVPKTTWRSLEWLVDHFGVDTLITEITGQRIAEMVAKRRGIRVERDRKTTALREVPSDKVQNATVNRYAVDPLRKLFLRARDIWGYPVMSPKWGQYRLREPEERVREAVGTEEEDIVAALGPDYGRLFRFMMAAGCRAQGALVTWQQIDRLSMLIRVKNKGRDGQARFYTIPLTQHQLAILDEGLGHHPTHVFTYEQRRPGKNADGTPKLPQRLPITENGFKTQWRRHVRNAGIAEGFRRHDTRHTMGTRLVRTTGNLKLAQKQLGHSRIETTMRYAHVLVEDIRAGVEAMEKAQVARNPHVIHPRSAKK